MERTRQAAIELKTPKAAGIYARGLVSADFRRAGI